MTQSRLSSDDILGRLVSEAVRSGADGLEIEYRDGNEEICIMKGDLGFGIASINASGTEARALREQLCAIGKGGKTITVEGIAYRLKVAAYDSFGETAYRVSIQGRPSIPLR